MIEKIKISNFKIFKSLTLDDLHQITLISGKNNVGKSTLLEAIFFSNDYFNSESFIKINNIRVAANTLRTDIWKSFINVYSEISSFEIEKVENGIKKNISVELSNNRNITAHSPLDSTNFVEAQVSEKTNDNRIITHQLSISASDEKNKDTLQYFVKFDGQIQTVSNSSPDNPLRNCTYTSFISSKSMNWPLLAEMLGRLDMEGKINDVVKALQILDPEIIGIKIFVQNSVIRLYASMNNGRSMPIDHMGDGICKLIAICVLILSNPNSLILVDEMENGFHYSAHKKIWEAVYEAAKISNVQVIATTHSYECIKGASEAMDENEDFGYIRLDNVSDNIVAKSMSSKQLKIAIESNLEVR
ncbi:MAG: AAA family ATPase [Oscillospiraceae bacterium]|nr:AAA family ATPase [Oscillospiraceae bacterium]